MKKTILLILLFVGQLIIAQMPAYYNNVNLSLTGLALKTELSSKVKTTHTTLIPYGWDAQKQADLNPQSNTEVLLIYGWESGVDNDVKNDRTRGVNDNGGANGQWNREHVFAKSLANPALTTSSPGAGTDLHNLRPADVQWNADRGNLHFATGTGHSGASNGGWYPGDEWKGDVARIIMYMYIRYNGDGTSETQTQCWPINVGIGTTNNIDNKMVDLFLQWNAEDPVSDVEKQRNPVSETMQGNRNPFIDNPAFATRIWGGVQAQDTWGTLAVATYKNLGFEVYPNPSNNHSVNVILGNENKADISLYNIGGQLIYHQKMTSKKQNIPNLPSGFYMLKITTDTQTRVKKVIIN